MRIIEFLDCMKLQPLELVFMSVLFKLDVSFSVSVPSSEVTLIQHGQPPNIKFAL